MHTASLLSISMSLLGLAAAEAVAEAPASIVARGPDGINNRGSGYCAKGSMSEIKNFIATIPDAQIYPAGFHIACSGIKSKAAFGGGTCAFLQGNSRSYNGAQVKALINLLAAHPNTQGCGSVPISLLPEFGGVNELSKLGMLTVNYVQDTDNPCPPGVCGAVTDCVAHQRRDAGEVDGGDAPKRRSRIQGRQTDINAAVAVAAGQTITVATGAQLVVQSVTEEIGSQPGFSIDTTFINELIPNLANKMGAVAKASTVQSVKECASNVEVLAQASSNQVLSTGDWTTILGSVAQYLRQGNHRQGARLTLAAAGGAVLSVYVYGGLN